MRLGPFLCVVFAVVWAEEKYYAHLTNRTWDDARNFCQLCFKDLVRITPANAELVAQVLGSEMYWIGLRKNFSGTVPWAQWSNSAPVTYQNWYPGHPVPKKQPVPALTCPALNVNVTAQFLTSTQYLNVPNNTTSSSGNVSITTPTICSLNTSNTTTNCSVNVVTGNPTIFLSMALNCSLNDSASDSNSDAYIEDSCVAVRFGMWWEKPCYDLLPYICYDDVFYGEIDISDVTHTGGNLTWSKAPGNINYYRLTITGSADQTTNETNLYKLIENLEPGKHYSIQVIPVKCGRDLNPQKISFYTLPNSVSSLAIVKVETHTVTLNWSAPDGGHDFYLVTVSGNTSQRSYGEEYTVKNLSAGVLYNFTVRAGVNDSTYGQPDSISGYTKPSPVVSLTSENNETDKIFASWSSNDSDTSGYLYHVILNDESFYYDTSMIRKTGLEPGSRFSLSVSALANGSLEGEARTISAYTKPNSVIDLQLQSTESSITVTWKSPQGNNILFKVDIFNSSNKNHPHNTANTSLTRCVFSLLKAAELYNVYVTTYVEIDDLVSLPVNKFIYTRPVPPESVRVTSKNISAVQLQWVAPAQSAGVSDITYKVVYSSPFWKHGGTFNVTEKDTAIIPGLRSGSMYYFNVSIVAGAMESSPVSTNETTVANNRTLALSTMCSSDNQSCMEKDTMSQLLQKLENHIESYFHQDIFWTLKWKGKK